MNERAQATVIALKKAVQLTAPPVFKGEGWAKDGYSSASSSAAKPEPSG